MRPKRDALQAIAKSLNISEEYFEGTNLKIDMPITKQSISRYEKGIMRPKRDALQAIAKALNISEEYFEGTNLKIDMPMLRTTSNGKLSEDELQSLEAKLSFWAEQYLAKEKEAGFPTRFKNPIKGTKVSTLEDAIHAADLLREKPPPMASCPKTSCNPLKQNSLFGQSSI